MRLIALLFLSAISNAATFKYQKLNTIGTLRYQYVHIGIPSQIIAKQLRLILPEYRLDHNAIPIHVIEGPSGLALAAPERRYDEISRHTSGISFIDNFPLWEVDYHRRITTHAADHLQSQFDTFGIEEAYEMIRKVVSGPRGWR